MAINQTNVQAQRSKKWIVDALIKLMHQDPFQKLTIKEIYMEAEVSRQTFYRHFKSKEEVLQYYFDDLCEQFIQTLDRNKTQELNIMLRYYFEFWLDYKTLVILLFSQVGQSILTDAYIRALRHALSTIMFQRFGPSESVDYIQDFFIGGLFAVKKKWIETGAKETPAQLANLVSKMVENVIRET